jgi:hypothetical protein
MPHPELARQPIDVLRFGETSFGDFSQYSNLILLCFLSMKWWMVSCSLTQVEVALPKLMVVMSKNSTE